ncbi:transcription factor bHLH140-like, partial [Bidens hawaiensis]|uniref:transcription factor bHLH140-like n=1 Tax=Bidens hawaiensis TaxID=980011 RepID=UPI004049F880
YAGVQRTGHEGNLQGGRAAAVVNQILKKKELPKLNQGFTRITICQNENDVQEALNTYASLSSSDVLPSGLFGGKKTLQLGIMKFLKRSNATSPESSNVTTNENQQAQESGTRVPTLAFPSISTADFQFDIEKASEIIVEMVKEFVNKIGNGRLVLVDLSHGSKILSLVKSKAAMKNIDPTKFFTFVGDITKLRSGGGLHCNVIANAANWLVKPGGGGVNAAIFDDLETETKKQAGSLTPGKSITVPLPSTSPLFSKQGVTHVIHVLGPNMNPNCLKDDYNIGCKVLREAYSSLFENFASVVRTQEKSSGCEVSNKKLKVFVEVNESKNMNKDWGTWAQALYKVAMHPEKHGNGVIEVLDDVVVLNDVYPKAQKHILVIARAEGLDRLADVNREHLPILRTMHTVGVKWAQTFLKENQSLVFRLGYHSSPSMRQLHLHVISQDFDSKHLRNKKHWNSFNTPFFRDSVDIIREISENGKPTLNEDGKFMPMELRCNRCRSAHPNIPRLKSHITICKSPFPANLLQSERLLRIDNAC